MNDVSRNIFVIGDLVVDHTVFVQEPSGPHQNIEGEPIYEVIRRIDTAGGAANTARILAILNPGHTFLWGLTGESNWGSFRSILEKSQAIDGASSNIKFRGVHDETHAQMNTITRLIMVGNPPDYLSRQHKVRFDDYGHIHVSEDKRHTVLHYLKRAHHKHTLHAIVLNDLDMNSITPELVKQIAQFANSQSPRIPLFVDPKRKREKYLDIEGTAILPNLAEWCHLVDERDDQAVNKWRQRLDNPAGLIELAQLSFKYLGNFRYHIIKCDKSGAVILAPHPEKSDRYAVYRIAPQQVLNHNLPQQLGCGDVMTGIVAMEFAKSKQTTEDILRAFVNANAGVACYRDMPWQRMPSLVYVDKMQQNVVEPRLVAEPSKGMLFLPKKGVIYLADYKTVVPGLYSADMIFKDRMKVVLKDLKTGWEGKLRSIILGAPAGSGKSTMISALKADLGVGLGINIIDLSDPSLIEWGDLEGFFRKISNERDSQKGEIVGVIDEALKATMGERLKTHGVVMLNTAHANNIRMFLIDALFQPGQPLPISSEVTSRCRPYYLPSFEERPIDIPYIVAGFIFSLLEPNVRSIKFDGQFLLTITDAILSTPNPRVLCSWAEDAYNNARLEWDNKEPLNIRSNHLPEDLQSSGTSPVVSDKEYEFRRDN
jgi:sugar/nucleoside kinase (ribokinase family)